MWSAIGNAITPSEAKDFYTCPGKGNYGCYERCWVLYGFPHVYCHVCAGRERPHQHAKSPAKIIEKII